MGQGVQHRKRGSTSCPTSAPTAVYVAPDLLDAATCRRVRAAMDHGTAEPAEVLGRRIAQDRNARRATSIEVDPGTLALVEGRLDSHRDAIGRFFGLMLTAREGAAFLRYMPGGYYRPHRDRGIFRSWPDAARRCIAIAVFLNSTPDRAASGGFTGGTLKLLEPVPRDIVPRQGACGAFPAAILHEVAPVVGGRRNSIVDWFYWR